MTAVDGVGFTTVNAALFDVKRISRALASAIAAEAVCCEGGAHSMRRGPFSEFSRMPPPFSPVSSVSSAT